MNSRNTAVFVSALLLVTSTAAMAAEGERPSQDVRVPVTFEDRTYSAEEWNHARKIDRRKRDAHLVVLESGETYALAGDDARDAFLRANPPTSEEDGSVGVMSHCTKHTYTDFYDYANCDTYLFSNSAGYTIDLRGTSYDNDVTSLRVGSSVAYQFLYDGECGSSTSITFYANDEENLEDHGWSQRASCVKAI